jgi:aspartyl-tRNA(Asn)/glutamyl-tRNA(Gln) amidotransferase subunit C
LSFQVKTAPNIGFFGNPAIKKIAELRFHGQIQPLLNFHQASPYICHMQVDDQLIEKLSRLSMLEFDENQKELMKAELLKMIQFIDKLKELDTTGVEPLLHMSGVKNITREDIPGDMLSQEDALKNAPVHDGRYFKVPKVIKK